MNIRGGRQIDITENWLTGNALLRRRSRRRHLCGDLAACQVIVDLLQLCLERIRDNRADIVELSCMSGLWLLAAASKLSLCGTTAGTWKPYTPASVPLLDRLAARTPARNPALSS